MPQAAAPVLVTALDTMCEPLRLTLTTVLKDNAVKQQVERHHELLRSAMRAVRALEKMPDSDTVVKFQELLRATLRGPKVRAFMCGCLGVDRVLTAQHVVLMPGEACRQVCLDLRGGGGEAGGRVIIAPNYCRSVRESKGAGENDP